MELPTGSYEYAGYSEKEEADMEVEPWAPGIRINRRNHWTYPEPGAGCRVVAVGDHTKALSGDIKPDAVDWLC